MFQPATIRMLASLPSLYLLIFLAPYLVVVVVVGDMLLMMVLTFCCWLVVRGPCHWPPFLLFGFVDIPLLTYQEKYILVSHTRKC